MKSAEEENLFRFNRSGHSLDLGATLFLRRKLSFLGVNLLVLGRSIFAPIFYLQTLWEIIPNNVLTIFDRKF